MNARSQLDPQAPRSTFPITHHMREPIYRAFRIDDDEDVFIVGNPDSNGRVWVCNSMEEARRNKGKRGFASDYEIEPLPVE